MEWAVDNITQQIINANDAIQATNRYICPECGAECTLRRGLVIKPYFAHLHGAAPEACENYHPGNGVYGNNRQARSRFQPYPKLYIHTYDSSKWYLELLIYDYPLEKGEIYIPFARFGQVKIDIPNIKVGGERIPVKIMELYTLQTNDEVIPPYKQWICSSIKGLDPRNYNVFSCANDGGMRLHEKQLLIWGQQYLIVWHMNLGISGWPPHNVLSQETLATNNQWFCKKISLPDVENPIVEEWVNKKLKYKIKHKPLTLSPLFPIPDRILDDGSFQISGANMAFLSIDGNTISEGSDELMISSDAFPTYTQKINLFGKMPIVFTLNSLPFGRIHLWINGDPDINLSLYHTQSGISNHYVPGVEFTFQDKETNKLIATSAFSAYTALQFKKTVLGNNSLVRVSIPKRSRVWIGFQRDKQKQLMEYRTPEVDKHTVFEDKLKDEIVNLLGKGRLEIDFGNYGRIEIDNKFNTGEKLSLTESNRKKLIWLITQVSLSNNLFPIEWIKDFPTLKIIKQQFTDDDYILINKLINNRLLPASLLPHARSVIKEITAQMKSSN